MAKKYPERAAGDFGAYMDSEIRLLLAEVEPVCPVASPRFNDAALAWVAKNAAHFRRRWKCYRDKQEDFAPAGRMVAPSKARNRHGS
ncbi:MAG: hypothetical protein JXA71_05115 [Chitinispirillaceae bacterium]|nr:hypothetical protein [Chitinispirillaceae bacterium]